MKASLPGIILFLSLAGGSFLLQAQTNTNVNISPARSTAQHENWMISFLTPAEQEEYAKARAKALADNPGLEAEGEKVMKQGEALMANGTMADKQVFMEKMNSHRQKLRQAMLKEDPKLEPIFAQIDKHLSEMKAKQLGSMQNSPGATNAPAAGPTSH